MEKLLSINEFEKTIYKVCKQDTLISIAKKTLIPPSIIIKQNKLSKKLIGGELLLLSKGDNIITLTPETNLNLSENELNALLEKNNVPYFYVGQIIKL